ncbi:hypothetical protein MVEG_06843 [Podila verticillata NRRL 6337]|nr:hypothetical protein MVEG_06843 [Podila verticillata NRRL 6337]
MTDNLLCLLCVVDGESTSFSVEIDRTKTVDHLKKAIKAEKSPRFDDIAADELTLWRVSIPDDQLDSAITIVALDDKTALSNPRTRLSKNFPESPEDNTYILVQRPPPAQLSPVSDISQKRATEELDLPSNKRIRIIEGWKQYTASDGDAVQLPSTWIDILLSTEFVPEPRVAFDHLKDNLQAGDSIIMPSMGQSPKDFGRYGQPDRLFVTEQMLNLWEDMCGDKERTYRRVLSGPMGVGKSYLSYFLAARAYAEGWLVLYISDAEVLDKDDENKPALEIVKRFLALNKDILTGAELQMLVNDYDGTRNISRNALSAIFRSLLMSRERKTLLLADEHGKLFEREPYVPDKFKSLVPLSSYHWWGEDAKGSRVIFTGPAHAKFEMEILDESYRPRSVVFVGPLSETVFLKLLYTYPRLNRLEIKDEVKAITNRVPRELVYLSTFVDDFPHPVSVDDLQKWTENRTKDFLSILENYYDTRSLFRKGRFYKALLQTFLGSTSTVGFGWDFMDLGLIYRSKDASQIGTQCHILCRPAQKALLELLKTLPLPDDIKRRIDVGNYNGDDFETALFHQLVCSSKPIVLNATDLNNRNPTVISLDFVDCDTLKTGFKNDPSRNQIECYLDDMYGPKHTAVIGSNGRFEVKRNDVVVSGFRIIYIRGSPGNPTHSGLVRAFPDVAHVTVDEIKKELFKIIV